MDKIIELMDKNSITFTVPYEIIRSDRKTCAIILNEDATLTVRLPRYVKNADAIRFLREKQFWIGKKLAELQKRKEGQQSDPLRTGPELTPEQALALEKRYRAAAKTYIPQRAAWYAENYRHLIRHGYSSVSIRDQKTRWGSCSSRGTLSFNWRLMLAPPGILDYVIVHELCHLEHMDHSKAFWQCVETILPDYRERRKWLKEHGHELKLTLS